LTLFKLV